MKKTNFYKLFRYYIRRFAYNFKILRSLKSISREKYDEKISASLVYGFLSAQSIFSFSRDMFIPAGRLVWRRSLLPLVLVS